MAPGRRGLLLLALALAALTAADSAAERKPPPSPDQHLDHHGHGHDHDHDHDHDDHGHAAPEPRTLKGAVLPTSDHDHDHDHARDHDHEDHEDHEHEDHEHEGHEHEDHEHGDHDHGHGGVARASGPGRFSPAVWAEALFATAIVGAAPVLVLLFVPLGVGNQDAQKPLLRVFLSFAAGGLLGDSLLHLLPHSIPDGHSHSHSHDHGHDHDHGEHAHSLEDLHVWLWTLAGMMTFLMLEKFVRAQTSGGHGHSHGHSHSHGVAASDSAQAASASASGARKRQAHSKPKSDDDSTSAAVAVPELKPLQHQPIAAAGYLNLAADFAHNFTDGLAIGATFLRGSGWQTTLAMLLHELPHEIGDFAILIQSGFTRREAMLTQLLTAVGAMVGTVLGLLMEGAGDSSAAWISPFTAGGFIYIACASVMPELLEDCSLAQSVKEALSMAAGIGLMALIALSE